MINALAELVIAFPGTVNQTRCFTHILNLVIKVILCQFDMPKPNADEALDVASQVLVDLAGNIEMEEVVMDESGDDEVEDEDGEDRQIGPCSGMSQDG